jgi:hypothetical protein
MMRKGDLAEYSPEWVLRTAAQEGVDGGIDFDVTRRISVYLDGGRIYLVLAEGDPDEPAIDEDLDDHAFAAAVEATEHRLLPHAIDLLVELLGETAGEYFHHPLNEHPLSGEWDWNTVDLIDDALRRRRDAEAAEAARLEAERAEAERLEADQSAADGEEGSAAGPEAEADVAADAAGDPDATDATDDGQDGNDGASPAGADEVDASSGPTDGPAPGAPVAAGWGDDSLVRLTGSAPTADIDADGWALIAAMADTIPVQILAARLGWPHERIVEVLDGLRELGAVSEESFGTTSFTPPASAAG